MQQLLTNDFESGKVLLIDKPLRWTSFDVIRKVRGLIKIKKVGHAGTLDPLATGLLIVCTGKFTKRINEFMAQEKEYTGTITLGTITASFDLETQPEPVGDYSAITADQIADATRQLTGDLMQIPPIHSAIKIDGKRMYTLARKGIEVIPEARPITIITFEITNITLPILTFRVVCTTGTYIRSLANDLGAILGCGGHLSSLRRTRIGEYFVSYAQTMDDLEREIRESKSSDSKNDQNG